MTDREPGRQLRTGHGDLTTSLVLVFPALLAYEVGVLFAGRINGADVVTRGLYALVGSRAAYLLLHAIVALLFLVWVRKAGKWSALTFEAALPVILEAAIYALTLGAAITLILRHVLGLGATGDVVGALGAGVHEELVFRLGLLGGIASMFGGRKAFPIALALSSPLFALAHHLGPGGEHFTWHAFAYRTLAGGAFGLIFWYRSLAHAVYAHVMYDLVVAWS
jgi:hypothetical protein